MGQRPKINELSLYLKKIQKDEQIKHKEKEKITKIKEANELENG